MCVRYVENGTIAVGADYTYVVDIANLFGHNFQAFFMGAVKHGLNDDVLICWPTFSERGYNGWFNRFDPDETRIVERNEDPNVTGQLLNAITDGIAFHGTGQRRKRYVFTCVLPADGGDGRRYFKGEFLFDETASSPEIGVVWNRIATEVTTYLAVPVQP